MKAMAVSAFPVGGDAAGWRLSFGSRERFG
jgi:hypothetical protein